MSRTPTLAVLALFALPAAAQIEPQNVTRLVQRERVVGGVYVGLPPGPCRSVETWFLFEDYDRPGDGAAVTVEPAGPADESLERFLGRMWSAHPDGTEVTVEITETSAACR